MLHFQTVQKPVFTMHEVVGRINETDSQNGNKYVDLSLQDSTK